VAKTGFFTQPLARGPVAADRDELLLDLCANKRVMHVGCADAPLTTERLDSGSLLHAKLLHRAADLLGVDINRDGVDLLCRSVGGNYLVGDVSDPRDRARLADYRPEVILAGDVIEHVRDAGAFLTGLAALMRHGSREGVELILSTPNGLAVKNVVNTTAGREIIHPDHVYVFTPASLSRLVSDCGLEPNRWYFYHVQSGGGPRGRVYDGISRAAARVRPAFSEGQVLVCQIAR
jgi:hypothetical protein